MSDPEEYQIPTIVIVPPPAPPLSSNSDSELDSESETCNDDENEAATPSGSSKGEEIGLEACWEIINSISNRTCLPSMMKDVPMHLAMSTLLISTSGFMSKKITETVGNMITRMNGTLTPNYTAITTHIVATHGLTEKVILARRRNLPVMTLEWVRAVWKACEYNPYIHASQEQFQNFVCPLFQNVMFCISEEVVQDTRVILKNLISKHGGKVMDVVKKDETDILICKNSQELCYKQAMHLSLPVVSPAWVTVSILDNVIIDYAGYQIRNPEDPCSFVSSSSSGSRFQPHSSSIAYYPKPDSWKDVTTITKHEANRSQSEMEPSQSMGVVPRSPPPSFLDCQLSPSSPLVKRYHLAPWE